MTVMNYTLSVNAAQINAMFNALADKPWREVADLMTHIRAQIAHQEAAAKQEVETSLPVKNKKLMGRADNKAADLLKRADNGRAVQA